MIPPTIIRSTTPTIDVYVKLAQYPILCDQIRFRMREELFRRGIVNPTDFEMEVKQLALESQRREGLSDPYSQEDEVTWQYRKDTIRDLHTDNYFGNNLGPSLLDQIIEEVLATHHQMPATVSELTFNPEIAPWQLLFRQGLSYENLPQPKLKKVHHHLEEVKVVLIKRLLSDHLRFIGVAKHIFSISDLRWIYDRLIGAGKIGGKASGILLAWKVLERKGAQVGPDISQLVDVPESYFVGSETIYEFIYVNKLERFVNQKYLTPEERFTQYPAIVDAFMNGEMPTHVVEQLQEILRRLDGRPYMVRSSSLLEDNLSHAFAGTYESFVCFNQANNQENLNSLINSIRKIYASTFNPHAMQERQKHGLIDYDERMAVIIQPLHGEQHGRYFWPTIVGKGISQNSFFPINGEQAKDGILRLVWGFDERSPNPFTDGNAATIPLDHPRTRNGNGKQSPQKKIRVIDLEENQFKLLPISEVLKPGCPNLHVIASKMKGDKLLSISDTDTDAEVKTYMLSFEYLTRDPKFVKLMRTIMLRLENVYKTAVEIEFAIEVKPAPIGVDYRLIILQCHPYVEN
jgi:hypothetical protein